jgi:hypothetical protein
MWWQVVFWVLLVPLIVIEFIVFLKTRKYSWLIFALAIFTYVIAVNYIIDVFSLGRNAIILILLASAGLMILIGKQLKKGVTSMKAERMSAIILASLLVLVFVASVIFGKLQETIVPAQSIAAADIARYPQDKIPVVETQVTILTSKYTNSFFLPVPVPDKKYQACINTTQGIQDSAQYYDYTQSYLEVKPGGSLTVPVRTSSGFFSEGVKPLEMLVFVQNQQYLPCTVLVNQEPLYRIPVV